MRFLEATESSSLTNGSGFWCLVRFFAIDESFEGRRLKKSL